MAYTKTYQIIFNGYEIYDVVVSGKSLICEYHNRDDTGCSCRGPNPRANLITLPHFERILEGNNRFFRHEYIVGDPRASPRANLYYPTPYDHAGREPAKQQHGCCTLLVEIKDNLYMLISGDIYLFQLDEPIVDFYSVITHNDMVIPVMIGERYVYCFYFGHYRYLKTKETVEPIYHSYDAGTVNGTEIDVKTVVAEEWSDCVHRLAGETYWKVGDFWSATFAAVDRC